MLSEETLRELLLLTARVGAFIFLGAFTGEALLALHPSAATRWLAAQRRALTLAFAFSHTVHLGLIVTLVATYTERFWRDANPVILVLALGVYGLIYALAWTELRQRSPGPLVGARFPAFAHWVIAGALARPIIFRAFEGRSAFYLPAAVVFVAAFGVRLAAATAGARRAQVVAP
jgi:hypothetical protein